MMGIWFYVIRIASAMLVSIGNIATVEWTTVVFVAKTLCIGHNFRDDNDVVVVVMVIFSYLFYPKSTNVVHRAVFLS